jgi:hypothetical protein
VNRASCVVDWSYTLLNAKENSSLSFFGLGIFTSVGALPSSVLAAVTMVSFSSSLESKGRIRATTRIDMMKQ